MPGNTIGERFQLTTFGESHGPALGGVLDGDARWGQHQPRAAASTNSTGGAQDNPT